MDPFVAFSEVVPIASIFKSISRSSLLPDELLKSFPNGNCSVSFIWDQHNDMNTRF